MDPSYSQQQHARHKSHSAASLHHLSLAPMTSRLPLPDDVDGLVDPVPAFATPSYLYGRSAPATPRLLSKSPPPAGSGAYRSRSHDVHPHSRHHRRSQTHGHSQSQSQDPSSAAGGGSNHRRLPKSHSTTHLLVPQRRRRGLPLSAVAASNSMEYPFPDDYGESSSDWFLRAGALVTSEMRESKGQSWLSARASSTSLTGLRDAAEEESAAALERELAHEREHRWPAGATVAASSPLASHTASRRGSHPGSRMGSRLASRAGSRAGSRVSSRVQLFSPLGENQHMPDCDGDGDGDEQDEGLAAMADADFVNLDEKLEALEIDTTLEDEDYIRRLVRLEKTGGGTMGGWLGSVLGWSLFSVYENDEDEDEDEDENGEDGEAEYHDGNGANEENPSNDNKGKRRRRASSHRTLPDVRRFEGVANPAEECVQPPPKTDDGGWRDAAWLLSVASKVIL